MPVRAAFTLGLLIPFLYGCNSGENNTTGQRETIQANIEEAIQISFEQSVPYSGTVLSKRSANISSKIAGEIIEMPLNIGDTVASGGILFKIKNDDLIGRKEAVLANLDQAEATLKNTETQYNRIETLFRNKSATQKEFDDITTQLSVARSQVTALNGKLKEVEDLLSYTMLEAPFNATVAERFLEKGDMANPGRPVMKLNESGTFKIRVTIPEESISDFEIGDSALVNVPSAEIQDQFATVKAVNRSGSPLSRQFDAELEFTENGSGLQNLRPGQFASVRKILKSEPLIAVKTEAIIKKGQLTGLYTLSDNNRIFLRWVRTGQASGKYTEILSGVKPGDRYIIPTDERLTEGLFVDSQ